MKKDFLKRAYLIYVSIILSLVAVVFSSINAFSNDSNLVYVDVNRLMEGYKKTTQSRIDLEKRSATVKATVDSLMNNWQAELQQYERDRGGMQPAELKIKQQNLESRQQQINSYRDAVQKQLEQEDTKTTQTVVNDINDYIKHFGEKNNYTIILGATGSGNIMYAAESTDITEEVLKGLNESAR